MDINMSSSTAAQITTSVPSTQLLQIVDLEGMAFTQGGHLMSNKKCKLPKGSFKCLKKGYEEIHIPAPTQKPTTSTKEGEKVKIDESMPEWTWEAFKGIKELNRVQSKVFGSAWGSDEPILLCAPTGAGKVSLRAFWCHQWKLII
jgi:pre-mRNA-splicing helicase BRR2